MLTFKRADYHNNLENSPSSSLQLYDIIPLNAIPIKKCGSEISNTPLIFSKLANC